jgi:hypothetical protein
MNTHFRWQWTNFQNSIVFCNKNTRKSTKKKSLTYIKRRIRLHCMLIHRMVHRLHRIMDRAACGPQVWHACYIVWVTEKASLNKVQIVVAVTTTTTIIILHYHTQHNINHGTSFWDTKFWNIFINFPQTHWGLTMTQYTMIPGNWDH